MNEYAELRSQTYHFFTELLDHPLRAPQWEELVIWASQIDSAGFLASMQEWILNNASLDKTGIQALSKDFTRLFSGIPEQYGPPPPYEHLYRQDIDPSDCKADVQRCYNNCHLRPRDPDCNISDHIVAELQYMALLTSQQHGQTVSHQLHFLNTHLLTWVTQWQCLVAAQPDQKGFYPKIIEALICFLRQDLDFISNQRITA